MSWSDAVTREAAWWTVDPAPGWAASGSLQLANGGPFANVQAFLPMFSPRERGLYIIRSPRASHREERLSAGGIKQFVHRFTALIQWPVAGGTGTGRLEDELQNLENATDAALARLRGPLGDKSHNGAFWSVGEEEGDVDVLLETDPYAASRTREPLVVRIEYAALDSFVA